MLKIDPGDGRYCPSWPSLHEAKPAGTTAAQGGAAMDTGKAIIISALIVAATGAATATLLQPRYSLTNVGAGHAIRLNRSSGDLMGCARLSCWPIVRDDKPVDPYKGDPIVPEGQQGVQPQR